MRWNTIRPNVSSRRFSSRFQRIRLKSCSLISLGGKKFEWESQSRRIHAIFTMSKTSGDSSSLGLGVFSEGRWLLQQGCHSRSHAFGYWRQHWQHICLSHGAWWHPLQKSVSLSQCCYGTQITMQTNHKEFIFLRLFPNTNKYKEDMKCNHSQYFAGEEKRPKMNDTKWTKPLLF